MCTKSATEQRKLIEQLMGKEYQRHYRRDLGLKDPKICKSYLVGECPFELFQNTKQNFGRCSQIHLAKYKLEYQRDIKKGKTYPEFEKEYFITLYKFIKDCDGQIQAALKKLEHTPEERAKIKKITSELDSIDSQIGLMLKEIEFLIHSDEVVKSMIQSIKLQNLQIQRSELAKKVKEITENVGQSAQQKLQVCKVCGAYLSRLDTDRRLADHFLGKVHLGYVKMRQEMEDLKRILQERGEEIKDLQRTYQNSTNIYSLQTRNSGGYIRNSQQRYKSRGYRPH